MKTIFLEYSKDSFAKCMSFHLCKTVLHEIKGIFSAYLNIISMMIVFVRFVANITGLNIP